ncbi:MAG: type II toxin-antitoxin system VapB family antitoxin [Burkholderiales bacterium]
MRTNIVIDEDLVKRAMKLAGVNTKRAAVEAALRHFVGTSGYAAILSLYGSGGVDKNYDPKVSEPKPKPYVRTIKRK